MPISIRLNTKIHLTILCLSGFELYSRWVPLCNWGLLAPSDFHAIVLGSFEFLNCRRLDGA